MDADELLKLIRQREPEGLKLDFKRKLYAIDDPKKQEFQWNEFIKDILALANGNVGTARQWGYLVFGIADELNQHGTRDVYDVGDISLSEKKILTNVNKVCHPKLPEIFCKTIPLPDGKRVLVIEIPPSPYLHETIRPLTMSNGKTTYPENTVFIRRKEDIGQASTFERQAILAEKQGITLPKSEPPKIPTQTKRTPSAPPKSVKKTSIGWLALLGLLICTGLLTFGIVMSLILSTQPKQTTIPTAPTQAASIQEIVTPTLTDTPTQQPTESPTPKPTHTATTTPTNTPVVPPTNIPTAVVLPTDTPSPPSPAAPIEGTGDAMTVDNWEIRFERIEFADRLESFDRIEKAAGRFAIVFLAITNRGLSPDTFVPFGTVEIRDGEGRPYEDHAVAGSMAQYEYKADIGADINPDETAHVVAVWDIPKRSDNYTLAPGSLAKSSTGVIPLPIP